MTQEAIDNLYFTHKDITLLNDSALNSNAIEQNSLDLIVTSPPYNLDIAYASNDDALEYQHYLEFSREWMANCYLWSKDCARFCLNIPLDKNKGGIQSVGADLTAVAKSVGWNYHTTIIWNESNISKRSAWGSWLSASAPYVIAPVELIVVFFKGDSWKKKERGESDITKEEFLEWTNGLWTFSGESKKKIGHPAPFPLELPKRCIKLFSYVGDVVCDPFSGSGTTMISAFFNNRKFIGIELDAGYCELSKNRFFDKKGLL